MRIACLLGLAALSNISPAAAAAALTAAPAAEIPELGTVVVAGIQPGPGLWQVSSGERVLWILGTVAPVPRKMQWHSPRAEAALAQAQEIIGAPGVGASLGVGGLFKAAFAMPTLLRARKNPGGKTLREVLPADLYLRWSALKSMYLGKDAAVEESRPIIAAAELYQAALKQAGLASHTGVDQRIGEIADKYRIKRTWTMISSRITDPKGLAKSFAAAEMDDVACFRSLLDRLELDVARAAEQANAWAVGDIPELTRLAARGSMASCVDVMARTEAARSLGLADAHLRSEAKWLQAVDAALAANQTSFATLPVNELLEADGLLSRLRAKGYRVVAPE